MEIICYSCGRGEFPENTIEGIQNCTDVNPDWRIEMDIRMTADKELVLFHDNSAQRTTGVNKLISQMTFKEIQSLNAGWYFKSNGIYPFRNNQIKVPLLKDVFIRFPKVKYLLDIHTDDQSAIPIFLDLIRDYLPKGDFTIVSEYDLIIKFLRSKKPNWEYGVPKNEAKKMLYSSFIKLDNLFPIQSDILMAPNWYGKINVLTKRVINHAHKRKKKIWAWKYEGEHVETITTKEDLSHFEQLKIDGIFTEFPTQINKYLNG